VIPACRLENHFTMKGMKSMKIRREACRAGSSFMLFVLFTVFSPLHSAGPAPQLPYCVWRAFRLLSTSPPPRHRNKGFSGVPPWGIISP
jgi:hypothetical protein